MSSTSPSRHRYTALPGERIPVRGVIESGGVKPGRSKLQKNMVRFTQKMPRMFGKNVLRLADGSQDR